MSLEPKVPEQPVRNDGPVGHSGRALVTGATGIIGANLVRRLLAEGLAVRAFVRTSSDLRGLAGLDVEYAHGDLLDPASLARAAAGCSLFFHAGTPFTYWGDAVASVDQIAVEGVLNALTAARAAGVERFVLTSSSVTFGSAESKEIRDESYDFEDPSASPYALSKVRQEQAAFERAAELNIPLVVVCPTVTVGPFDFRLSESNAILTNYLSDPFKSTFPGGCNIVSARDVAEGHLLAALQGTPGERYILGSENIEWPALHRTISEMCGAAGPHVIASSAAAYLAAASAEALAVVTGSRPASTRVQAKMVGRYYWYSHARAAAIGYRPRPARQALAEALSWLVASEHVPMSVRRTLKLAPDLFRARKTWSPS